MLGAVSQPASVATSVTASTVTVPPVAVSAVYRSDDRPPNRRAPNV